jgi:mediator of RNA polymerase II transcription subunit 18
VGVKNEACPKPNSSAAFSRRRSQIFKRGYLFRKGSLVIQMFQQEQVRPPPPEMTTTQTYCADRFSLSQVDPKTSKPIPAHADTLWEVEVKTASPVRNTPETPLSVSVEAVMEIQILMKGLLDLRRQDS